MFNISKEKKASCLTITLDGRLDTTTAPQLEDALKCSLEGIAELVIDIDKLEYISSAGLRVLLSAQKTMNRQGSLLIKNASKEIMEIFDVTGFTDILNIE